MIVRNIIFDLGNVLVDVNYEKFCLKLLASGADEISYNNFFLGKNYRSLGYESGKISTDEFVKRCIAELKINMSENEFADAFNDMFFEIKPMSSLVRKLAKEKKYNLYLLSNTSPLHFDSIKERYGYISLLNKCALSYELKALKPEPEIYQKAIAYLDVTPEECIFIDDLKENCEGAEKSGIKSIQYDLDNHIEFENKFYPLLNNV